MRNPEQTSNLTNRGWFSRLFRRNRDAQRSRYARDIIEMVMPSRPLVAKHQKTAALHIQLANEIEWTPRRAPASWRGR